jgi:hypothetical protein
LVAKPSVFGCAKVRIPALLLFASQRYVIFLICKFFLFFCWFISNSSQGLVYVGFGFA